MILVVYIREACRCTCSGFYLNKLSEKRKGSRAKIKYVIVIKNEARLVYHAFPAVSTKLAPFY